MHKLLAQLRAARSMPWRLVLAKLLRRTRLAPATARRMEILADPQTAEVDRMPRLYLGFAKQAAAEAGWTPIDFRGARVLEIGCGPLAGIAPLAITGGAARYLGVDPGADPALLYHPAIVQRFLEPALARCRSHHTTPAEDVGIDQFKSRAELFSGGLAAASAEEPFTAATSISCLEHIADLPAALARLRSILSPDSRQLHLVNFSNHLDKAAPFKHLYEIGPDAHRQRYGNHINMLRPSDVERAFREAAFTVRMLPVDVRPDAVPKDLHADWANRYGRDELAIRTALVLSN